MTAVMSRLQALETRGASATTSTAQRFWGKEDGLQATRVEWREERRLAKSFNMKSQNVAGALHDDKLKVVETWALRMHQWCIDLPGACEALCHWRGTWSQWWRMAP